MATQVKSAAMLALNTALATRKGNERIAGPMVRFNIVATGKTPRNVAVAIFQRGGGFCGERNHASNPCKGRCVHEFVSVSGSHFFSQALKLGDAHTSSLPFSFYNRRAIPHHPQPKPDRWRT